MDGASIPGPYGYKDWNAECLGLLASWSRNSIAALLAQSNVRKANNPNR